MTTLDAQSSSAHEEARGASTTDDDSLTTRPPRPPREDAASGTVGPLDALPGPDGTHQGWDATSVSTAKCDMCHRQRCGTIQKCSECKLSVCMACAVADRLRGDARHVLDPSAVDWTGPPALSRLRRLRASRTGRVGGARRADARSARAQQARGRRRSAQPRPVPSRATSTSFSSPASPLTDIASPAFLDDDAWGEGYSCLADEGGEQQGLQSVDEAAAATAAGGYLSRIAKATSLLSAQTAQTDDAAEILAQMPRRHPCSAAEQQQRNAHPYGSASVLLPPVRSAHDPQKSSHLPPLRTLHPQLGVENAALQPLMVGNRGPLLPHPTGHWWGANDMRQGASSYDHHRTHGYLSWDAQQQQQQQHSHAFQHAPTAATYCNENEGRNSYSTLPAASTAQGASFTDYSYSPQRNDGGSHSYQLPTIGYSSAATTTSRAEAYESRSTVQELGTALKSSTLTIQAAELPGWPLDWCLQLALARTWAQHQGEDQRAFFELRAAAYAVVLALDLPERHNAARAWLGRLQHSLQLQG